MCQEHQRGELLLPLRLGGQMPQRLGRRCRAGPLPPAGPAARRLRPGHLQRGASARLLPPLPGLWHEQELRRRRRRRAAAWRRPVPRSAPGARLRPATLASLRLGGCSPEGASPRFAAGPDAGLRWQRRGLAGRRGGARLVLSCGRALPGPFREQQSLAGEGLPGQFQRRKRSQLAHCKERPEEALPLHEAPDAGAGEGVSVQHVPYSRAAPRDQPQRPPHGQTS
uniref:Homeobox A10 n=1 Tax=Equus caballus TaxID=9796 RepID=A0A9L0TC44_HORSE